MKRLWLFFLAAQSTFTALGLAGDPASWATVEKLRLGQSIRVQCLDQRQWTGRLAVVSADSLTLDAGGTGRKLGRSDVQRIEVRGRGRNALVGLGIGAGAGVGIGFGEGGGEGVYRAAAIGTTALVCAAVGAGIGALFPSWKAVYRVEPSRSPPPNAKP